MQRWHSVSNSAAVIFCGRCGNAPSSCTATTTSRACKSSPSLIVSALVSTRRSSNFVTLVFVFIRRTSWAFFARLSASWHLPRSQIERRREDQRHRLDDVLAYLILLFFTREVARWAANIESAYQSEQMLIHITQSGALKLWAVIYSIVNNHNRSWSRGPLKWFNLYLFNKTHF